MKKLLKKYSKGGNPQIKEGLKLVSPFLSLIPGAGVPLSMGVNLLSNMFENGGFPNQPYEVENNEVIMGNPQIHQGGSMNQLSNNSVELSGNTHNEGGIQASGGDYIFSDKLKPNKSKLTFAQIAKKLNSKVGKLEKLAKTEIDQRTVDLTKKDVDSKLSRLASEQETMNQLSNLKKFAMGGIPPNSELPYNLFLDPTLDSGGDSSIDIPYIEKMQPSLLKPLTNATPTSLLPTNNSTTTTPLGFDELSPIANQKVEPISSMGIPNIAKTSDQLGLTNSIPDVPDMGSSGLDFGDAMGYLGTAAKLAPTIYNIGQGLFGKKDHYQAEPNTMKDEALRNLNRSTNYEVGDQLESVKRGYQNNLRNIRNITGGNSGEALRGILSAQNLDQQQKGQVYGNKARYEADANRAASQIKLGLGEQDRQENISEQMKQLQLDALKRRFLSTGLEGVSGYSQMQELNRNRKQSEKAKIEAMKQIFPYATQYYFNDDFYNNLGDGN